MSDRYGGDEDRVDVRAGDASRGGHGQSDVRSLSYDAGEPSQAHLGGRSGGGDAPRPVEPPPMPPDSGNEGEHHRDLTEIDRDVQDVDQRMKDARYLDDRGKLTDAAWKSDEARGLAAERRDLLREGVESGDFSVPEDRTPVFYSGTDPVTKDSNDSRARAFVRDESNSATRVETTDAGGWLDRENTWDEGDPLRLLEYPDAATSEVSADRPEASALWKRASERYATSVVERQQPVVAFVNGARDESIWKTVEQPILNERVPVDER